MVTPSMGRPPELRMTGTSSLDGGTKAASAQEAHSERRRAAREDWENIRGLYGEVWRRNRETARVEGGERTS